MGFNFDAQLNYRPISSGTIEQASATPFSIAGKAMNNLDAALENRAFERDISTVTDLKGLAGLNATTDKQRALMATKQGQFQALNNQAMQEQLFGLKKDTLAETERHNTQTELASRIKSGKGFGVSTDPITGQTRVYSKDTGKFGGTAGGVGTDATDSGEPISSKTAVKAMPDGTTIYTNRAGEPLLKNGQVIVKARSKFNLDKPSEIAGEQATMDSLKKIKSNVESNPDAVGSLGSGAWNFIGNNINDMLKVPTDTRLARNQITASAGVLAANIRSMFEKGVMTEPDFERYKRLVPNENDSVEEFKHKLNTLQEELGKSMTAKAKMQGTKAPEVIKPTVNLSDFGF